MQEIFLFIFAVSGLSWIVTKSKIMQPLRERISFRKQAFELLCKSIDKKFSDAINRSWYSLFEKLLNCYGCFGFWSFFICYGIHYIGGDFILYGFAGSMVSLLLVSLAIFLERK